LVLGGGFGGRGFGGVVRRKKLKGKRKKGGWQGKGKKEKGKRGNRSKCKVQSQSSKVEQWCGGYLLRERGKEGEMHRSKSKVKGQRGNCGVGDIFSRRGERRSNGKMQPSSLKLRWSRKGKGEPPSLKLRWSRKVKGGTGVWGKSFI